jgi:RNA polymerase sigma factor (sigma-70 family)
VEIVTAQAPGREVTALYEAHALSLIRLAYVMLGDRPAAEDVVQEAFLRLYQRWSKLRDTASAPGYLRASVLNGCRMALRSSARRDGRIARMASELPWESAEATALVSEEYRHLLRGIQALPPRQREALVLRYYLDLSDQARLMEIMTYTLATGAFRSWTTSRVTNADASFGFTGSGVDGAQSISWAADSRTLAFGVANTSYASVRLLDTAAGGTDLMADSRLAVTERNFKDLGRSLRNAAPPYYFVSCITDAMISMDGSAIVCGYSTSVGNTTTMGFAQYSTATGKMNHVVGLVHFEGKAPIGISLYWG